MKHGLTSGTMAQIATILAKEYGVRVQLGGNRAYTRKVDDKWTINMPALATDEPFYMDLMRCYLDHESGHVRFSDMDRLNRKAQNLDYLHKSVWNIFEDIFVERKMSRSFPGCARNLRTGVEKIFADNYQLPDDLSVMVLDYILFKARHLVSKAEVFNEKLEMLDTILPNELKVLLDGYISRAPGCNSTRDTEKLTEDLCRAVAEFIKEMIKENDTSDDGDEDGGAGISVGGFGDDGDMGQEDGDITDTQSNKARGAAELGDIPQDGGVPESQGGANGASGKSDITLDDVLESLMSSLVTDGDDGKSYDIQDRVNELISGKAEDEGNYGITGSRNEWEVVRGEGLKKFIGRYLDKLNSKSVADAQKESARLASQLAGLLQTMVMNRGGFSTRGKLDSRRLARIAVGRPDIFSSRVEKKGLDTEVIIALDVSGSMGTGRYHRDTSRAKEKIDVANEALFSILTALKSIQGVKSMAYTYSNRIMHLCEFDTHFNRNSLMFVDPSGGTPTGEALQYAITKFSPNAKRKLVILITDGDPDNRDYFRESLRIVKRQGVEVVGVGIMDTGLCGDMNANECFVVNDLKQLAPQLFKILRDKLLNRA